MSSCCQRNSPYMVRHPGTPVEHRATDMPAPIRHFDAGDQLVFDHLVGCPCFVPAGKSGFNSKHWASVRSARPAAATLFTRSPVFT